MNYIVYRIVNDNGHVYFGHTSLTLKRRFNLHKVRPVQAVVSILIGIKQSLNRWNMYIMPQSNK